MMSAVFSISVKPARTAVSVEQACIDLADRRADLAQGVAEGFRQCPALLVEVALGRDIVRMERIRVGLVGECGAMAHEDDEPAGAQCVRETVFVRGQQWSYRRRRDQQTACQCE